MGFFSNLRLRYQLLLLTTIAVALVIVMQTMYYLRMTTITRDKIKAFTDQSVSQVEETINIMFDKVKNGAMYFAYSSSVQIFMATDDMTEKIQMKKYIEEMIKMAVEINSDIEDVILVDPNGKRLYYYNDSIKQDEQFIIEMQKRKNDRGILNVRTDDNRDYIAYMMPVIYTKADLRYGRNLGSIIVLLNRNTLNQIINKAANPDNAVYYILNNNKQVVLSNINGQNTGNSLKNIENSIFPERNITIKKDIANTGWSIIGHVNEWNIVNDYDFFKNFGLSVGIIMVLLLISIGMVFNRSFALPVAKLLKEIDKVGKENLKERVKLKSHNEIGDIASNINRMLENHEALSRRIFETQKKMYETELSKKQTDLYALQSQVNPHFLFNTLQCIGGIAMSRDIPEVAEVIIAMGDIFRYSIKGDDFITVREEVDIAKQYMKIIDIRFGGRIKWAFDIQDEILECRTIKMILQPLIENSIYHGLEKIYGEGYLYVKGWLEEENIIFEIQDNGPGIEEAELTRIQAMLSDINELEREGLKRKSIGVANIQWRIKLMLGEKYGLNISRGNKKGAVIRIELPVII